MKRLHKILLIAGAAAVAVTILIIALCVGTNKPKIIYNTETVKRSNLFTSVSAIGTVEPEELVNVGAQVGGMITCFGKDADGKPINYGSRVTSGMQLAQIDDALYRAEFDQAQAQVMQCNAQIKSAEADIVQARSKRKLAQLKYDRAKKLNPAGAVSRTEYDTAVMDMETAAAGIVLAESTLAQRKAQLKSAEATLARAKRNLGYCTISSPVDGVIIDRRVNIGQTVVSSMSAPSLFLIAKDLRKMQVWVSVNEVDVGSIKKGMPAVFTVDTFGTRKFQGVVQKIRLNATMSQNVVTYIVEVGTDNSDLTLLPYLTANVKFIIAESKNVLAVPNSALRWKPEEESAPQFDEGQFNAVLYKLVDGKPVPVPVKTGLNSGVSTAILAGDLAVADEVICSSETTLKPAAQNAPGGSPFLPTPPKRQRKKK